MLRMAYETEKYGTFCPTSSLGLYCVGTSTRDSLGCVPYFSVSYAIRSITAVKLGCLSADYQLSVVVL